MKFNRVLIDVSNIYWKAYSTTSHMSFSKGNNEIVVTGGVFTTIRSINKIVRERLADGGYVYFLFDATHKKPTNSHLDMVPSRKEIDPDYKANRKPQDETFYWGLSKLQEIFSKHSDNFKLVEIPGLEADDLVKPIIDYEVQEGETVLMVSDDKDWGRAITDSVFWLNRNKDEVDRDMYHEIYGFYPDENRLTIYKSFRGDDGDGVPKGVLGMREKDILQLLEEFTDIHSIYNNLDKIDYISDTWKKKMVEGRARVLLNYTLVDYLPVSESLFYEYMYSSLFDPKSLRLIYKGLGFRISEVDKRLMNFQDRESKKGLLGFRTVSRA